MQVVILVSKLPEGLGGKGMESRKQLEEALRNRRISRREFVKRGVAAGLSLTTIGALLSACGRENSEVEEPSGKAQFGDLSEDWSGTTLNVSLVGEPRSEGLKEIVGEFTDQTGIEVNLNIYPYETLQERQFTSLSQQTGNVDIVHVDLVWMGQYAGQGWLEPVDQLIENTNSDVLALNDFNQRFLEGLCQWEGTLYGLPFITAIFTMYYRRDIFEKYDLEPPQTWNELRELAQQIHEQESGNGVAGLTMMARRGVQLVCSHLPVFGAMGGYYYDDNYNATMDTDAAVESITYLKSLLPFCNDGVLAQDYPEAATTFQRGGAAMNLQWQNAAPLFVGEDSEISDSVEITLVPGMEVDGEIRRAPTLGGWNLGIAVDSQNKEAAWEFIVWATKQETEKKLASTGTGARESTLTDPQLSKRFIEYEATFKSLDHALGRPRIADWTEMNDTLAIQLSEVMTDQTGARQAMEIANEEFNQILKEGGYQE